MPKKENKTRDSVRSSKRKSEYDAENEEPDGYVEDLIGSVIEQLEASGYGELVGLEVVDSDSPFFRPASMPGLRTETEEDYDKETLFRYIRKSRNYGEKARLRFINLAEKKEMGGLFVSGTLIDYFLFQFVVDVVKSTRTLTVLRLVDCSVKAEGISVLGKELGSTLITYLYLDRNPVEQQNYYCVLKNNKQLKHLSLAACRLDWRGAKSLGRELGPPMGDEPDHRLKSLNLSNNRIDSYAAKFLARGLKWNRDLLYISLAGNNIGNVGIEFISNALQLCPVEKWEKQFMEERNRRRVEIIGKMLTDEFEEHRREMLAEYGETEVESESTGYETSFNLESLLEECMKNDPNPISRDIITIHDKLMTTGNKTLRILDISYNKIEEDGFKQLLNLLRYQIRERRYMSHEERQRSHLSSIKLAAKKRCYPDVNYIKVTDTTAEIKLQALLDQTASRLLEAEKAKLEEPLHSKLTLISKRGFDGSSGHSEYKQKFGNFCSECSKVICKIKYYLREMMNPQEEFGWEGEDELEVAREEEEEKLEEIPEEQTPEKEEIKPTEIATKPKKGKKAGKFKGEAQKKQMQLEDKPPINFDELLIFPSDSESSDLDLGSDILTDSETVSSLEEESQID